MEAEEQLVARSHRQPVQLVGDFTADVAESDDLGVDSPASFQDAVADPPALGGSEAEGIPNVDHQVARGGPGHHQPGGRGVQEHVAGRPSGAVHGRHLLLAGEVLPDAPVAGVPAPHQGRILERRSPDLIRIAGFDGQQRKGGRAVAGVVQPVGPGAVGAVLVRGKVVGQRVGCRSGAVEKGGDRHGNDQRPRPLIRCFLTGCFHGDDY